MYVLPSFRHSPLSGTSPANCQLPLLCVAHIPRNHVTDHYDGLFIHLKRLAQKQLAPKPSDYDYEKIRISNETSSINIKVNVTK